MTTMYIVVADDYDDSQIMGLWFSKPKAVQQVKDLYDAQKAAKKAKDPNYWYGHYSFNVEEYDTDDEPRVPVPKNVHLNDFYYRRIYSTAKDAPFRIRVLTSWISSIQHDRQHTQAERDFAIRVLDRLARIIAKERLAQIGKS